MQASVVVVRGLSSCGLRALESRLSSCSAWALWHVGSSRTRARTVPPALAGGFLTTVPPGSPKHILKAIVSIGRQIRSQEVNKNDHPVPEMEIVVILCRVLRSTVDSSGRKHDGTFRGGVFLLFDLGTF